MGTISKAASKVTGVGRRITGVIRPLGIALPVAIPNINALFTGGPRGLMDYNIAAVKTWRPPDWGTITAYIDGPGGVALLTAISAGIAKKAIKALELEKESGALVMLIDAVKAWGDGSAVGYAMRELIYPTVAGGPGTFSTIASPTGLFGGGGSQPPINSAGEMATKDDKPVSRLIWQ